MVKRMVGPPGTVSASVLARHTVFYTEGVTFTEASDVVARYCSPCWRSPSTLAPS